VAGLRERAREEARRKIHVRDEHDALADRARVRIERLHERIWHQQRRFDLDLERAQLLRVPVGWHQERRVDLLERDVAASRFVPRAASCAPLGLAPLARKVEARQPPARAAICRNSAVSNTSSESTGWRSTRRSSDAGRAPLGRPSSAPAARKAIALARSIE